jgi:hypothetical protein
MIGTSGGREFFDYSFSTNSLESRNRGALHGAQFSPPHRVENVKWIFAHWDPGLNRGRRLFISESVFASAGSF